MLRVIPSILTNDPNEFRQLLSKCEGVVDTISLDIIDGEFADNKTIDPTIMEEVETTLKIDYQLMVKEPTNWLEKCVRGQADRIIGHVEMMSNQRDFVGQVQSVGRLVGLAIDLATPVSEIDKTIINDLDVVLVMSVPAGFVGQKFNPVVLKKFDELNEIRKNDNSPFKIHDDGGVTFEYIDDIRLAGVDEVSIGKRIFAGDLKENIAKFMQAAYAKR